MANGISEASVNLIITAVATLLAGALGYFGSRKAATEATELSYKNIIKERETAETNLKIVLGNMALYKIFLQLNTLANLKLSLFDKHENNTFRYIDVLPFPHDIDHTIAVDCESLIFFMQYGNKHEQLIYDLCVSNANYASCVLLINRRNSLFINVKNAYKAANIAEGQELSHDNLKAILGDILWTELQVLTDKIYDYLPENISELEKLKDKLRLTLVQMFPAGKFAEFERLDKNSESAPA